MAAVMCMLTNTEMADQARGAVMSQVLSMTCTTRAPHGSSAGGCDIAAAAGAVPGSVRRAPRGGAGLPKWGDGLPRWGDGLPRWGDGLPKWGAGLPRWGAGLPSWGAGLPRWGAGEPSRFLGWSRAFWGGAGSPWGARLHPKMPGSPLGEPKFLAELGDWCTA